jgi:hypothetical protein
MQIANGTTRFYTRSKIYAYSAKSTGSFTSSGTLSVGVTADWDAADAANTLTSYKNIVQIFRK